MSLSKAMLETIQKAGAAVFDADAQLKLTVKAYGERLHAAVGSNPYHLGNDALFENWKLVARLSQTMTGMEEELRKVYQVASELSDVEPPALAAIPALGAPGLASLPSGVSPVASKSASAVKTSVGKPDALAATDVKIKKTRPLATPKATTPLPKGPSVKGPVLPMNAVTLLKHLGTVLTPRGFASISQTEVSQATGIPLGSMTASLKRLVNDGHVLAGPNGQYKLAR
jgi:hypothetical protein